MTYNTRSKTSDEEFTELESLRNEIHLLKEQITSSTTPVKEGKVPDTPIFTGNSAEAKTFLTQLKVKFLAEPLRYSSSSSKAGYAISRLGGDSLLFIIPYLDATAPNSIVSSFPHFVSWFETTFLQGNHLQRLEEELKVLTQGNNSVALYSARFLYLASQVKWDDSRLLDQFKTGLNIGVKKALVPIRDKPNTLHEYTKLASEIDNELMSISSQSNISPIKKTFTSTRRGPLSEEEKARRIKEKLCLYCGGDNHLISSCKHHNKKSISSSYIPSASHFSSLNSCISSLCTLSSSSRSQFILPIIIHNQNITALLDTGACSNFISHSLITSLNIPFITKSEPYSCHVVDGRPLSSGTINTQTNVINFTTSDSLTSFNETFDIISSPHFHIILGLPWFQNNSPFIDWSSLSISFPNSSSSSQTSNNSSSVVASLIESTDPSTLIPTEYHDFIPLFSKSNSDKLPIHRPSDMSIDLLPGTKPSAGPIYRLSEPETQALKEYIEENLEKKFIRPSQSTCSSPVMFVPKRNGDLRLCVDYRKLNSITISNTYPLPLISELIDRTRNSRIFTKLDLRNAYNLIRIKAGDEWKTSFRCRHGQYEYLVMPFGLKNAPSVFQQFMDTILHDFLDKFALAYEDDILIYSENIEDHIIHVRKVLQTLLNNHLYLKLEKCEFHKSSVNFLGYTLSTSGVQMNNDKVASILDWKPPKSVHDIQVFLGFANFYRRFIPNFSKIVRPLTLLLRKNSQFRWTDEESTAFETLKSSFTSAPILHHADPTIPFIVETDASDYALGAILSQYHDNHLHPVAFYSRSFLPAEVNYDVHDKELLAIKVAFEQWRHHLIGARHPILVYTDHKNLQAFQTSKILNRRQARWSQFFSDFQFNIVYRPGSKQGKPDALSRRSEYIPKGAKPCSPPLLPPHIFINMPIASLIDIQSAHRNEIRQATSTDPYAQSIIHKLNSNTNFSDQDRFSTHDGCLFYDGLLYVPSKELQLDILRIRHDAPTAGHFGVAKTLDLIKRDYWWPSINNLVQRYVHSCPVCAKNKIDRHKPHGLLHPLPIPDRAWSSISLDFITDLPPSNDFDSICVVVDRLTKMSHFIPCLKSISAEDTAFLFIKNIFRLHGIPSDIVSDRGPQFISRFWIRFFELLGSKINLSSGFHPESNGQTERVNQTLEQYLRCFINFEQNNWVDLLPLAEFSYNNTIHTSINQSPFFANYNYHPDFDPKLPPSPQVPAAENQVSHLRTITSLLRDELRSAQSNYKRHADRRREDAPRYKIGDKVWLRRKYIKTTRTSSKLDHRKVGPYEISGIINDVAFKLKLPDSVRTHNVFHVSLLEPYVEDPDFPRTTPDTTHDWEDPTENPIERLIDSRYRYRQLQYLVKWRGEEINDSCWTNASRIIDHITELKQIYHRANPGKAGPQLTVRLNRS